MKVMTTRKEAQKILTATREEADAVKQILGHPNSFWTTEGVKAATIYKAKAAAVIAKYAPEQSPYQAQLETILRIPFDRSPNVHSVIAQLEGMLDALATDYASKKPLVNHPKRHDMAKKQAEQGIERRKVFVVHGRNNAAREALFTFLRAIGLQPLEWSGIVKATGKASPYIGEVLEKGFSIAQAVVVLMTPDDEARLREQYRGPTEPPHETDLTPQPRPNVLLEAGMALGLFPNRTVIVELGTLRPVSDIGGRHVIRMNDAPDKRHELAQRLQTAGCEVNTNGTDWYKAGTFAGSVAQPRSKGRGKRSKP
jgi:predicted nucleotide-binding protein